MSTPQMRNYPLFELMSREHGLTLTESELDEIECVARALPTGEIIVIEGNEATYPPMTIDDIPEEVAHQILRATSQRRRAGFCPSTRICIVCDRMLMSNEGNKCGDCDLPNSAK